MEGESNSFGILPNSINYIFNQIQTDSSASKEYLVHCRLVSVYIDI